MANKKLKKLMTDVAKGKISKQEADSLLKGEKVAENEPVKEIKDNSKKDVPKKAKNTHKRKKSNKSREVK